MKTKTLKTNDNDDDDDGNDKGDDKGDDVTFSKVII